MKIRGNEVKRLWNMCMFHGVELWNLKAEDEWYYFSISRLKYESYLELLKKANVESLELGESGLPAALKKIRKRWSFYAGAVLAFALVVLLSRVVWGIKITGNSGYGDDIILRYLEKNDIVHGMRTSKIGCTLLASGLREEFPNITWVTVKIRGTNLLIEMKENILPKEEVTKKKDNSPSNIVAEREGVITEIITRSGTPKVHAGDQCQPGDVLVEGVVPIYNDSQELVREDFVHADADIQIQTAYDFYYEFERNYETRKKRDAKEMFFFQLGNLRLGDRDSKDSDNQGDEIQKLDTQKSKTTMDKFRYINQVYLTQSFSLPIYYGKTKIVNYDTEQAYYEEDECRQAAGVAFENFLKDLKKEDKTIVDSDWTMKLDTKKCVVRGKALIVESGGVQRKLRQEDMIRQENAEDNLNSDA